MKNSNLKKILSTMLFVALVLMTVFAISACKKEHEHEYKTVTVDPTCTSEGSKTTTCLDPECDFKEVEVLAKASHNLVQYKAVAATCTKDGNAAYVECKDCNYTTYSKISKLGHSLGQAVKENIVNASCTKAGHYDSVQYCATCGAEANRKTITISATGHTWVEVPAKAATCQPGHYAYSKCACGSTKDYVEIPKAYDCLPSDHPIELPDTRVDATCTEDGHYDEAIVCMNDECHAILSDINVVVLEKLGHDFVDVEEKDATCTENGWSAHKACTRCDVKEGYEEKLALGHTPGDVVVENNVDPTCASKGSYDNVVYCTVCEAELERNHFVENELPHAEENKKFFDAQTVTCTEIGWDAYWVCGDCGYSSYVEIPALEHKPSDVVIENLVEPTCAETGSYDRVIYCTREDCEAELSREPWTVPVLNHAEFITIGAKAPTCTEIGWNQYTCCSKCSYTNDYVEIPALDHDIVKLDYVAPNCVDTGLTAGQYCTRCDACTVEQEVIPANGHSMVYLQAVPNTCTENGLTAGQYCANCDACTVNQTVVTAPGHNYDANGYCVECSHRISLNIKAENGVITSMGTCNDKNVVIPEYINGVKVVAIAAGAFKYSSNIETVYIPSTVKVVGDEAFIGCTKLREVVIGDGVESIAANAFFGCTNLTSITIGRSVKSIGDSAFYRCVNLSVVNYAGTEAEWKLIKIGYSNNDLTNADRNYI